MTRFNLFLAVILSATILILIGSCERRTYYGNAIFYFDMNGANASVSMGGQTGNVNVNFQDGTMPACGTDGCANFTLPEGYYSYTASSNTATWTGNVTIQRDRCTSVALTQATGSVVFWTQLTNTGNITVNIGNTSGTINSYITGGTPTCGFTGCATFDLQPGTYAYTASAPNGYTWNGNITITEDQCQPVQFN